MVDLQYCVKFRCKSWWIRYIYFFTFISLIGYYKILSRTPSIIFNVISFFPFWCCKEKSEEKILNIPEFPRHLSVLYYFMINLSSHKFATFPKVIIFWYLIVQRNWLIYFGAQINKEAAFRYANVYFWP